MNKMIIIVLLLFTNMRLLSQEISFSKNNLYFSVDSSHDKLSIYNKGSLQLFIDSIYSKANILGYGVTIHSRDTIIYSNIYGRFQPLKLSINGNDSINIFINRPFCSICKRSSLFIDTIVVHSNSIVNVYSYISVGIDGSLEVKETDIEPNNFILDQNYPNPFNPSTSIPFSLSEKDLVTLSVYNVLGQEVSIIFKGKLDAGNYIKQWDGHEYNSGTYYYKIETSKFSETKKMILMK